MTKEEERNFKLYLQGLTDAQVINVLIKERQANRRADARLAENEALRRNLEMP